MSTLPLDFDTDINAQANSTGLFVTPEVSYWADHDRTAPRSPWGPVQHKVDYKNGIIDVSTSGHGGLKVTGKLARKIPKLFRKTWYEEDCEYVIPLFFLYDEFKAIADQISYEEAGRYGFLRAVKRKSKDDFKAQLLGYGRYAAIWDFINNESRDVSGIEGEWEQREYRETMAELKEPTAKVTGANIQDGQLIRFGSPVIFTVNNETVEVTDFRVAKEGRIVRFKPIGHAFMARIKSWKKLHFFVIG